MALGTKAGDIYLDLNLNQKGFNAQLNGLESIASKAGKAIASAFAVKEIVNFGKECIELGSDLAEVQNVVDVAFPTMSKQIDSFAADAAKNFGLSETMAKRFTGTFGSMATAFGFTESQAASMATTLTGLAGDVASFYNISQDEAYTKLKSVFTGETESLKDLGVVMTQTALDQYALANGFGKTTSAMSEGEKVALRYAFVQSQLTNAAGDFSRTSDSWANQIRILSLQFDSLKAAIGDGLINVLKPVVQLLNMIISKLVVAAKAFASFTAALTKKGSESSKSNLAAAATSADNLSSAALSASDNLSSATSSAKELKRTLAGFDQITKLEAETGSSTGGNTGAGGLAIADDFISQIEENAEESANNIAAIYFKQAIERVKKGWEEAFKVDPKQLEESLEGLNKTLIEFWNNPELTNARTTFLEQSLETFGSIHGAVASIAASFAIGISSGIQDALEDLKEFNATNLSNVYGNLTNICATFEELSQAFSVISKAAESEGFKKIVSVLTKFNDVVILYGLESLTGELADLFNLALKPIIDNADIIEEIGETALDIIGELITPIDELLDLIAENSKSYEHSAIHKFLRDATSNATKGLRVVLQAISKGLKTVKDCLEGNVDLDDVWDVVFQVIMGKMTGNATFSVMTTLFGKKDSTFTSAKEAFEKLKDEDVVKTIKGAIANTFKNIKSEWEKIKNGEALKTIKGYFGDKFEEIRSAWNSITSSSAVKTIKGVFGAGFDAIKKAWDGIKDKAVSLSLKFSASAQDLKNWINTNVIGKVNNAFSKVPILKNISIPKLAQGGYVKANTPQLAMIGDNRHQGEVVAPENKLEELARRGAELAGTGNTEEVINLLKEVLVVLKSLKLTAKIDIKALKNLIVTLINENTIATGECELIT